MALLALVAALSLGQADVRAECLKRCAGAPKDAKGQALLVCLEQCRAPDAGTRAPPPEPPPAQPAAPQR